MKPESRAKHLQQSALREAQKALRRHPDSPLTREELLQLKVQAAPWWLRLPLALGGVTLIVLGAITHDAVGILAAIAGLILLLAGLLGWRRTFQTMLDGLGDGLAEVVINAIFEALN